MTGITVLNDVILPESLMAAGLQGVNSYKNTRTSNQGGYQQINVNWPEPLLEYDFGFIPTLPAIWQQIEGLHRVTYGGAYGFLIRDPKDSTTTTSTGYMQAKSGTVSVGAAALGYGVPTYQIGKVYTSAGSTRTSGRLLTRPVTGGTYYRGGVALVAGVGAGNIAVNLDTGIVTFVADTSQALTSVTAGATTILTFSSGAGIVAAMSVGQRVYLSGLSGTAATTLNSLSHAITAKGASSLTVSTVTTGLAATGGTAYKYPQASESLAWAGSFYVPVHFAEDSLPWQLERGGPADTRLIVGQSIRLQEVRE
jgi:hypothetical protein